MGLIATDAIVNCISNCALLPFLRFSPLPSLSRQGRSRVSWDSLDGRGWRG